MAGSVNCSMSRNVQPSQPPSAPNDTLAYTVSAERFVEGADDRARSQDVGCDRSDCHPANASVERSQWRIQSGGDDGRSPESSLGRQGTSFDTRSTTSRI